MIGYSIIIYVKNYHFLMSKISSNLENILDMQKKGKSYSFSLMLFLTLYLVRQCNLLFLMSQTKITQKFKITQKSKNVICTGFIIIFAK